MAHSFIELDKAVVPVNSLISSLWSCHRWSMALLETPRHSQASLVQSLVGSLLLSPGSLCTQVSVVPSQSLFPILCKFWQLYGGVNGDLLKRAYATPRSAAPRAPAPETGHCWPVLSKETLEHSTAGLTQALWGLLMCTRFVWALRGSLVGMGFDSKCDFTPPTV